MDTVLPLTRSRLSPVESAFIVPGGSNYGVAMGLGNSTRVKKCMERHQTTGQCWGEFEGEEHSTYVSNKDHIVACYVDENRVTDIKSGNVSNPTNKMVQLADVGGQAYAQATLAPMATMSGGKCGLASAVPNMAMSSQMPGSSTMSMGSLWQVPVTSCGNPIWGLTGGSGPAPMPSYGSYSSCPNCANF